MKIEQSLYVYSIAKNKIYKVKEDNRQYSKMKPSRCHSERDRNELEFYVKQSAAVKGNRFSLRITIGNLWIATIPFLSVGTHLTITKADDCYVAERRSSLIIPLILNDKALDLIIAEGKNGRLICSACVHPVLFAIHFNRCNNHHFSCVVTVYIYSSS